MTEWNLPPGPPIVTDNASNMTVVAEELGTSLACGEALKITCYIRVSTHIAGLAAKPKDVLDTLDLTNFGVKTPLVYWSLFRYN